MPIPSLQPLHRDDSNAAMLDLHQDECQFRHADLQLHDTALTEDRIVRIPSDAFSEGLHLGVR